MRPSDYQALEPRVLLDAAAAVTLDSAQVDVDSSNPDKPVATSAQTEDARFNITGLQIEDTPGNDQYELTLTLNTDAANAGTVFDPEGSPASTVTLSGTTSEINAQVATLDVQLGQDYTGDVSIAIALREGGNLRDEATYLIPITPMNDNPVLTGGDVSVSEHESFSFTLDALGLSDADVDSGEQSYDQLIIEVNSLPAQGELRFAGAPVIAGFTFDAANIKQLTYTNNNDIEVGQTDTFGISVHDPAGTESGVQSLNIQLQPVNNAPAVEGDPTLYEGQTTTLGLGYSDEESGHTDTAVDATVDIVDTSGLTDHGTLFLDSNQNSSLDEGEALSDGAQFQADTLQWLSFAHDGDEPSAHATPPSFVIRVTDAGGGQGSENAASTDRTIQLTVLENNDDPSVSATTTPLDARNADNSVIITTEALLAIDPDSTAHQLIYVVSCVPTHGQIQLNIGDDNTPNWVSLVEGASFTQADVEAGKLRYVQTLDANNGDIDSGFTFEVQDSRYRAIDTSYVDVKGLNLNSSTNSGGLSFTLDDSSGDGVSALSNLQFTGGPSGVTFNEGDTGVAITSNELWFALGTADNSYSAPPEQITYTITTLPAHGTLMLDGVALTPYGSFTQADINNGLVTFDHDGSENHRDGFNYIIQIGQAVHADCPAFFLNANPLNDVPSGADTTVVVSETYLDTNGNEQIGMVQLGADAFDFSDADGSQDVSANSSRDPHGEAQTDALWFQITSLPEDGTLERWNGVDWVAITADDVNATWLPQALLTISINGESGGLRYTHGGGDQAAELSDSITYVVRDDLVAPTAISDVQTGEPAAQNRSATATITLDVVALNDAPLIPLTSDADDITLTDHEGNTRTGVNNPLTVFESGSGVIGEDLLSVADTDNTTRQATFVLNTVAEFGTLTLDGVELQVGSSFTQEAVDQGLLRYEHDGTENFADQFTFTVSDGVATTAEATFDITVSPANEVPTANAAPIAQTTLLSATPLDLGHVFTIDDADLSDGINAGETDQLIVSLSLTSGGNAAIDSGDAVLLIDPSGATLTTGTSGSSAELILSGTLSQLQTALSTLQAQALTDLDTQLQLVMSVDDRLDPNDNTAGANAGTINSDGSAVNVENNRLQQSVVINTSTINDAPTATVPNQTLVEDTATRLTGLSILDSDSFGQDNLNVTLTVASGTLESSSIDDISVNGQGTDTLVLGGSLVDLQTALNGIEFTPASQVNGDVALSLNISDSDAFDGGHGASNDITVDAILTILPSNDAPMLSLPEAPTVIEGQSLAITGIVIGDDQDAGQAIYTDQVSVTLSLMSELGDALGSLATISTPNTTDSITLTGTLAEVQTELNSLVFTPNLVDGDSTARLQLVLNDLGNGSSVVGDNPLSESGILTLHIQATNDAPVISVDGDDSATAILSDPQATLNASGSLSVRDVNTTDTVMAEVTRVQSTGETNNIPESTLHALLTLSESSIIDNANTTGDISWVFDGESENFDYLAQGEQLVLVYDITARDSQGATDLQTVTITINGTNDAPSIYVDSGDSEAAELSTTTELTASGTLSVIDPDNNDGIAPVVVSSVDTVGNNSTISETDLQAMMSVAENDGDITWGFSDDSGTFEYLAEGETLVLDYTLTVTDQNGGTDTHVVSITITGSNASPVITLGAGDSVATTLTENGSSLSDSGTLSLGDVDLSDSVTPSITGFAVVGDTNGITTDTLQAMLSIDSDTVVDGNNTTGQMTWRFNSGDETFSYLDPNDQLILTYDLTVTDTQGATDIQTVTVTIVGINNTPIISTDSGDTAATNLTETDTGLVASGTLSISDRDNDDSVANVAISQLTSTGDANGLTTDALQAMLSVSEDNGELTWAFGSGSEAFNHLAAGETLVLDYTLTVTDQNGGTADQVVSLSINGTNDTPVIILGKGGSVATSLTENGSPLSDSGKLSVGDLDLSDTVTPSITGLVIVGDTNGMTTEALQAMLSVGSEAVIDGESLIGQIDWAFNSGDETFAYLDQGDQLVLTYNVTVTDTQGATDTQTVTVTINGINNAPEMSQDSDDTTVATLAETDTDLTVSGTLSVDDVDNDDSVASAAVSNVAATGDTDGLSTDALQAMLSVSEDNGELTWTFNSGSEDFSHLAAGETLVLDYTLTITDQHGGTATQVVSITLAGTNDSPAITIGGGDSAAITLTENGSPLSDNGTLSVADLDVSDTVTPSITGFNVSGDTNGIASDTLRAMLSIGSDAVIEGNGTNGEINWSFDSGNEAFAHLGQGEQLVLTYDITVTDTQGGSDTQTVTVTINGTNNAPTINGDNTTANITETDTGLTASGTLSVTDTDNALASVLVSSVTSTGNTNGLSVENLQAMLSVSENSGELTWSFDSGAEAFNHLATGETLTLNYTLTVTDQSGGTDTQVASIVITGTNDSPVITLGEGDSAATILTENGSALSDSGTLSVGDLDVSDTVTPSITGLTVVGDANGMTTETLQAMLSVDSEAVIDGNNLTGQIDWTFNSGDETFAYLDQGDQLVLTYDVTVTDTQGATDTQTVTVTINGANNAPEINQDTGDIAAATLTETDTSLAASGTLSVSDVDNDDSVASAVISSLATTGDTNNLPSNALQALLSVSEDNGELTWTFNSGSEAFNHLSAGETLVLDYTLTVTDQNGGTADQVVSLSIAGTNDAPVIILGKGGSVATSLTENGSPLSDSGILSVGDLDVSDTVTPSITGLAVIGDTNGMTIETLQTMLSVGSEGVIDGNSLTGQIDWTFNSGEEAFAYLDQGDQLVLAYDVTVTDTQGATDTQTVTVTINGTNNAPVISLDTGDSATATFTETNSSLAASGTLSVSDVDNDDTVASVVVSNLTSAGDINGLSTDALQTMLSVSENNGGLTWAFNSGNEAFGYLGQGEQLVLTYDITVTDTQGGSDIQTVTVTINGINNAPTINGDNTTANVTEDDTGLTASGTLSVTDTDNDSSLASVLVSGITSAGDTNGLPVENLQAMLSVSESNGELSWSFDSGTEAFNHLAVGDTLTLNYSLTVTDQSGGTDTQVASIIITGTNDSPVITLGEGDSAATTLTENGASLSDSGTLNVGDLDVSDTVMPSITGLAIVGDTNGMTTETLQAMLSVGVEAVIDGSGLTGQVDWTFNSGNETFAYLDQDDQLILTYDVTVTDTQGATDTQTVTITINGTNNAPEVNQGSGDTTAATLVETDTGLAASGTLSVIDIDNDDSVASVVVSNLAATGDPNNLSTDALQALLSVSEDNGELTWAFNSGSEDFSHLAAGETLVLDYTLTITDQHGGTATQVVSITLAGTNDSPILTLGEGDSAATTLTENGSPLSDNGTLSVSDLDSGTLTPSISDVTVVGDTNGITLDTLQAMLSVTHTTDDINWSFNSDDETFTHLDQGDQLRLTYNITVTDALGASDKQAVTITINGTNTAPIINESADDSASATLAETNSGLTTSGTLSIDDVDNSDSISNVLVSNLTLTGDTGNATTDALRAMLSVSENNDELTWAFDSGSEAFNHLAAGETLVLDYTLTATDQNGGTADQVVSLSITGTNDAPVIILGKGGSISTSLTENGAPLSDSGILSVGDVDISDTVMPSITGLTIVGDTNGMTTEALQAMLSVGSEAVIDDESLIGQIDWRFNSGDETFAYLDQGDQLVLTYDVTVTDTQGATDTQTVTVTINGVNNTPEINQDASDTTIATLAETDAGLTVSGTLSVDDVDNDDSVASVVVSDLDTTGGTSGLSTGVLQAMLSVSEDNGELTWTFDSDAEAFNYLTAGETLVLDYTLAVTDQNGGTATQVVSITLTGTNDSPVIQADTPPIANLSETNAGLTASGTLSIADADNNDAIVSVAVSGLTSTGDTGGLPSEALQAMLSASNNQGELVWSFDSDTEAFNHLADGQTLTLNYTLTITDQNAGTDTQVVSIILTGTNDAPEITLGIGDFAATTLTENGSPLSDNGTLSVADLDLSDTVTSRISGFNIVGDTNGMTPEALQAMLSIGSSGVIDGDANTGIINWTFNSNDETFAHLDQGDQLILTYNITVTDAQGASDTQSVTVTINGINNAPTINVGPDDTETATLLESDTGLTASGTLSVSDLDNDDTIVSASVSNVTLSGNTDALSAEALQAMLSIAENGSDNSGELLWAFDSGAETFSHLAAGETLVLDYTLTVTDQNGGTAAQVVSITLTGTNDSPIITLSEGNSATTTLTENGATLTDTGTLTVGDVDVSDTVTTSISRFSAQGDTNGIAVEALQAMLSINSDTAIDDSNITGDINWAFNSGDETFAYLDQDDQLILTYDITVTDAQGATDTQTVAVTINGTNNAPVINVDTDDTNTADLTETHSGLTTSGTLSVSDADNDDSVATVALSGLTATGDVNGLPLEALQAMFSVSEGNVSEDNVSKDSSELTWAFDSGTEAFDYLAAGETLVLDYTLSVTDQNGATASHVVTITLNGTNEAPEIHVDSGDSADTTLTETNASLVDSGILRLSDQDKTDTVHAAITQLTTLGDTNTITPDTLRAMLSVDPNRVIDDTNTSGDISWRFNSGSEAFDHLDQGDQLVLNYEVTATDSQGATDRQIITVTLEGTNDAPVISVENGDTESAELTESTHGLKTSGTLTVTDLDRDDTLSSVVVTRVTATGERNNIANNDLQAMMAVSADNTSDNALDNNGNITWQFDSGTEGFDYLATGESLTLDYTLTVTDSQGATDTQVVSITISGANEAPVITIGSGDSASTLLNENGSALSDSGTLSVSDQGITDTVTPAVTNIQIQGDTNNIPSDALQTMLSVQSADVIDNTSTSGTIRWAFNSGNETFDHLNQGDRLVLTYEVTATDSQGVFDTQTVTVTIIGTNNAPDIQVNTGDSATAFLAETNQPLTSSGTLSVFDADNDDALASVAVAGVAVSDRTTNGVNLGIANADLLAMLSVVDSSSESSSGEDSSDENSGGITWSFNSSTETFDALANGDTLVLDYTLRVTDQQGAIDTAAVTVTITGTNDAPEIRVGENDSVRANLNETNAALSGNGRFQVADLDAIDDVTASVATISTSGNTGGIPNSDLLAMLALETSPVIDDANTTDDILWQFHSGDQAFDYLEQNETLTLSYEVVATDSQGADARQTITITITGTNEAPVITLGDGDSASTTLTENGSALSDIGTFNVADVDTSDTVIPSVSGFSSVGDTNEITTDQLQAMLSLAPIPVLDDVSDAGKMAWQFDSGSETFAYLEQGERLTLSYDVTVTDTRGATDTQTVTVTIIGTNSAPVISVDGNDIAAATLPDTDVELSVSGTLSVSDSDNGDSIASVTVSSVAPTGSVNGAPVDDLQALLTASENNGEITWHFNCGADTFDYLAEGEALVLDYTLTVTDQNGGTGTQVVSITLTGTNESPIITLNTGDSAATTLTESGATLSDSGTLSVGDLDLSDTVTPSISDFNTTGDTNGITAERLQAMLTVNTQAVIDGNNTTGDINWAFNSGDETFTHLDQGDQLVLTYDVTVTDSQGATDTQTVTVTIIGTNNTPIISVDSDDSSAASLEADAELAASGTLSVTDSDNDDSLSAVAISNIASTGNTNGLSSEALQSMMTVSETDGDIVWTFNSDAERFDHLAVGETLVLDYTLTVTDQHGEADTQTLSIAVTGTNASPTITLGVGDSAATTLTENGSSLSDNGTLTVVDVDISDTLTASITGFNGVGDTNGLTPESLQAMLALNTNAVINNNNTTGVINWVFNSGEETFAYLDPNDQLILNYEITVTDTQGATETQTVTVTIVGTNNAPIINLESGDTSAATLMESDTRLITSGTLSVSDVDSDDSVANVAFSDVASIGEVNGIAADDLLAMMSASEENGQITWQFNSDAEAFDHLAEGETLTLNYTLTATDQNGGTDTQVITVTITGSNDAPVISVDTGDRTDARLIETNSGLSDSGSLTLSDADLNDVPDTIEIAEPSIEGGNETFSTSDLQAMLNMTVEEDGSLTWTFDSGEESFDALSEGETLTLIYPVTITDSDGGTCNVNITIIIEGRNDSPVISVDAQSPSVLTLQETGESIQDQGFFSVSDIDANDEITLTVSQVDSLGDTQQIPEDILLSMLNVALENNENNPDQSTIAWHFDSQDQTFDHLGDGELLELTFSISALDSHGKITTQELKVVIEGANNAPIITTELGDSHQSELQNVSAGAEEANGLEDAGTLTITDRDLNDGITVDVTAIESIGDTNGLSQVDLLAMLGATVNSDANENPTVSVLEWTFKADNATFDYLDEGERLELNFTVTAKDELGATSDATVTVTIIGASAAPQPLTQQISFMIDCVYDDESESSPNNIFANITATNSTSANDLSTSVDGDNTLDTGNGSTSSSENNTTSVDSFEPVQLTVALSDVLVNEPSFEFSLPANAFESTNNERISIEAVQGNDSPLPEFVVFDANNETFQVDRESALEKGLEKLSVKVTGSDESGNEASTTFVIYFTQEAQEQAAAAAATESTETTAQVTTNPTQEGNVVFIDEATETAGDPLIENNLPSNEPQIASLDSTGSELSTDELPVEERVVSNSLNDQINGMGHGAFKQGYADNLAALMTFAADDSQQDDGADNSQNA